MRWRSTIDRPPILWHLQCLQAAAETRYSSGRFLLKGIARAAFGAKLEGILCSGHPLNRVSAASICHFFFTNWENKNDAPKHKPHDSQISVLGKMGASKG